MKKQFILSVVLLFVASMLIDFVVHGLLLKNSYAALPNLMRGEADAQRHFPWMLLAHVLIAIGVTGVYRRGVEPGKGWVGQGIRFGIWFAIAACVPGFLIYHAVQPAPYTLAVKQVAYAGIGTVLLGIAAAAFNRPAGPQNP